MKTVLAENRFPLTKVLFTEGMLRVWKENAGSGSKKLLAVLCAAWIALTVYTLAQGGSLLFPAAELAVLALVALWATVWLPRQRANRAYKAMEAQGTAESERVTRFYADRLEIDIDGSLTEIDYTAIKQTLTSKNLLILVSEDKRGVLLKRDSFTLGAEEDVLHLIENAKKENELYD